MASGPTSGVVLAAGVGSRLRPLTDATPKALIPFFGWPLLDLAVAKLAQAGVRRVAVNTFHLAEQVARHVRDVLTPRHPDLELHLSPETELLGTGGALKHLAPWLGREPFWVVNADVVFEEDLRALAATHARAGAAATLLVTRGVSLDLRRLVLTGAGELAGLIEPYDVDAAAFCGVQLAEPTLLDRLPDGPACNLRDGHLPHLAGGLRVATHETRGFWSDLGTPWRLAEAHRAAWRALPRLLGPPTACLRGGSHGRAPATSRGT
ncbi:MAG: NTP transferase domain-containing protein [Deltaproteobacteria bacterium]|nr:NTP transferase domain-containing protein [Deltaproteobacteria bacterium]